MNIQYILMVSVIIYIIYFYAKKRRKQTKETNLPEKVITQIINKVESVVKRVIPIPVLTAQLWTYIEPLSDKQSVHRFHNPGGIPDYFQLCIDVMKIKYPSIIVLTPENISEYVDNFPIYMNSKSEIPLRKRVDLLFSFILEKHGGLCLSPGTIVLDISEMIHQSSIKGIVTCGTSPKLLGSSLNKYFPDTLVIGGNKGSSFLKEYKQRMVNSLFNTAGKLSNLESYDILSLLLNSLKPEQFHISDNNNGTHNKYFQKIDMSVFLSKTKINYSSAPLFLISFPYEEIFEKQYRWFLNMSKQDLIQSKISLIKYLI
jgi:hypothetical protein